MGGFDFDHWKHLAERDPAGFFQARDAALREWIARHPDQGHLLAGLQARLLQRTTRSVTLTDAGELALRRCQQMLALTTDLEEETATTAEGEAY